MSLWSRRRQFEYLGVTVAVILAIVVLFARSLQEPLSCIDGIKNQDELGVDCGGACPGVCPIEVSRLVVLWSKVFPVASGAFDAAAFIENPNPNIGARKLNYRFRVFDDANLLVTERVGTTYLNPSERAIIFEPRVETGERIPRRAFIDFEETPDWVRVPAANRLQLVIENKRFTQEPLPRLTATIVNQSVAGIKGVEASAVLIGSDGNAFAVSRTLVGRVAGDGRREIIFTWPEPFEQTPAFIDILVRANLAQ